ncbi:MAG: bile acid:sodium symporter [Deltaproteobacteria bacterium]|nr:bile acid:sodium symporter [Deltaproteobacteria bacterium]
MTGLRQFSPDVLRRHWFLLALLGLAALTAADRSGLVVGAGRWLGARRGAQVCAFLMFLFSGLGLDGRQARRGLADVRVLAVSLAVIFVGAPLVALAHSLLPLEPGIRIGLLLVSIMPTTLSSGVVMGALAGGNLATSLVVTVAASWLGILTIPLSLEWLLGTARDTAAAALDTSALAGDLAILVALPLVIGMGLRRVSAAAGLRLPAGIASINQCLVLAVVWIALSRSHATIRAASAAAAVSCALAFSFHAVLLLTAAGCAKAARLGPGRREVVWFMGGQKTLPIAVLVQTALFPTQGQALVFCVVHHIVHLATDAYLVGKIAARRREPPRV